jgi:hypothetical protein
MTQKKEIVQYVVNDVLELTEEAVEYLVNKNKFDTVRKLSGITDKYLTKLVESGEIMPPDSLQLMVFREWYINQRTPPNLLPPTLALWRETLTAESFDNFKFKNDPNPPIPVISTSPTAKPAISIKLADYPYFNGKMDSWTAFKQSFTATVILTDFAPLLNVTDLSEHQQKMSTDQDYSMIVRSFFGILMNRTATGLAASKVTRHAKDQDGVLAWNELMRYYDMGGNLEAYASQKFKELTSLEYRGNAHGGFDAYINRFESICLELERSEQKLSDSIKKIYFLNGIQNPDFDPIKDHVSNMNLQQTIIEIRRKAQDLISQS